MIITFNELRELKAALPDGAMHRIAEELNVDVDTVRNYFGGTNFDEVLSTGLHLEAGPNGGLCCIDDTTIYDKALQILAEYSI